MNITEYALITIVVLLIAYLFMQRYVIRAAADAIASKEKAAKLEYNNLAISYLHLLCRELANELIQRDAEYFRRNYVQLAEEWRHLNSNDELSNKTLEQLSLKYPSYQDFPPFDVHDYVLVGEAAEMHSNEELWQHYRDAKIYAAILCDDGVGSFEKCDEYLKSLDETNLLAALMEAEKEYHALRANGVRFEDGEIDTLRHKFIRLPAGIENKIGVFIKSKMKYGVVAIFHDDQSYVSYYKSNRSFDKEEILIDVKLQDYLSPRTNLARIKKID